MRDGRDHGVTGSVTGRWPSEARATLGLALPLVAAQLATVAMGVTDTLYLGRLGPAALAGGGLASSIQVTAQIVAAGSLAVLAPLLAEALARRDDARVASLLRHGLLLASALSVVSVVIVSSAGRALRALHASAEVVSIVDPFAGAVAWATPFALASSVLRHLLTAAGKPRIVGVAAFGGALLNVVLDALLIRVWGPAGVGAATAIAHAGICCALAVAAARLRATATSSVIAAPPDLAVLRDLVRLGVPAAVMIAGEVAVFQLAGLVVEGYGTAALAAHQLALTVVTATFVIPLGIAQATAVRVARVGVTHGVAAQRRAGMVGLASAAMVAGVCATVLVCAPDRLARLFVDDDATTSAARAVLRVAAVFLLFDAAQVVAAGALRGILDTRIPAILALGAYGILAPLAGALAAGRLGLRLTGVWLGLTLGLAAVGITLVWRFVALTRTRT